MNFLSFPLFNRGRIPLMLFQLLHTFLAPVTVIHSLIMPSASTLQPFRTVRRSFCSTRLAGPQLNSLFRVQPHEPFCCVLNVPALWLCLETLISLSSSLFFSPVSFSSLLIENNSLFHTDSGSGKKKKEKENILSKSHLGGTAKATLSTSRSQSPPWRLSSFFFSSSYLGPCLYHYHP